jgi:type I restriction enzyme R subunit
MISCTSVAITKHSFRSLTQEYCSDIRDGFLPPYKVVKVHIDRDVEGYRPEKGTLDREGQEIEDRIYNTRDFDRTLVLDDRTRLVAKKVTEFLKESGDRFQKTIVFCVDQEHAARMRRALVNENADLLCHSACNIDPLSRGIGVQN